MKRKAFYELIGILKERNSDHNIDVFIEKYTLEDILLALKGNGVGVNAYPDSKSYEYYLKIREKIYSKFSTHNKGHLINKYEQDIKSLNALFDDLYLKDQFNEVIKIDDENKLFAFLIVLELYVRALKDIKLNNGKNKDFYGDVDIQKNINGKAVGIEELTANQFTDVLDYLYQQASKVVQAFIFHGYLYENNEFKCCKTEKEIDWADIDKSFAYFSLIDIRTVVFELYEDWKFGNYEVRKLDEKNIEIFPKNSKRFLDEKIEIQRFESFRQYNFWGYRGKEREITEEVFLSKSLAPNAFLDEEEKASYNEYLEYFFSDNLEYKVNGVEIVKWLRAYAVVRYYNRDFLNKNLFPNSARPENWLYVSTVDEWIKLFILHGLDMESAKVIFDKFIFKKHSVDWLDSPFIKIGEKVITIPSVVSTIQDVLALMSMATKEDINLDFKGFSFEDRILNDLQVNKIPAVGITRKVENTEYQCDVAFILGKDLFLCECKHTDQPITQRKKYDFYNRKIPEDVEQINRIADYYSLNLNHVIDEFKKRFGLIYTSDWRPRCIYRMIIYSCKLSRKYEIDRVIITDYTVFTTLLYKRLPTIFEEGKPIMQFMPPKMKGVFQGKLTSNKLLNYLDTPWQIEVQKAVTKVEDEVIPINQIQLHRKKVSRVIDHFYELK